MIDIFLIIVVIELGILIFLNYKKLPEETQQEIKQEISFDTIGQNTAEVLQWKPPEAPEETAVKKVLKRLRLLK